MHPALAAELPDLARSTPAWLALTTVGVNALAGALRGYDDDQREWDLMGVATFALLMGLGGGFVRDALLGDLPAESLRTPWPLTTVIGTIAVVHLLRHHVPRDDRVMMPLDGLALGLFAVTGTQHALDASLPVVSAVFVGTVTAVGGGVVVALLQHEVPQILVASAPYALLAVGGSTLYALTAGQDPRLASVLGVTAVVLAQLVARARGIRIRPARATRRSPRSAPG